MIPFTTEDQAIVLLTRPQLLRLLQWSDEKWWELEAEKGFADQRVTDAQREIEQIQTALKEGLA